METKDPRESRDLIDQSRLLTKRAEKQVDASRRRIERGQHKWLTIAVGRVCTECQLSQADGEFEDQTPCRPRAS
jgi:hypothetical protein